MERNQKDRGGQFDQTQQRDKLHGAGKEGVDPAEKSRQKQGGQQGGSQFERDVPSRGNQDPNIDRQTGTNPGRTGDQGMGQSGSPRQPGVGESGRTPGQEKRST